MDWWKACRNRRRAVLMLLAAPATLVILILVFTVPLWAAAPALHFCGGPTALPGNTPLDAYSPALCIGYEALAAEKYTVRVFLLEQQTGRYLCASTQWCGEGARPPAILEIDNRAGDHPAGQLLDARTMDVFSYNQFLWVADLYNQVGSKVASATLPAQGSANRAPVLQKVGALTAHACEPFTATLAASDSEGDPLTFTAENLPSGAALDAGSLTWACPTLGRHQFLLRVVQAGPSALEDAELVELQVTEAPPQPPLLSACPARAAAAAGEGGPRAAAYVPSNPDAYARALAHLEQVMDKYHTQFDVYTDLAAAGNHFFHRARIQTGLADPQPVSIDDGYTLTVHTGSTAIRNDFTPTVPNAWGGWYLMVGMLEGMERVPKDNWGTYPNAGYNLTGATELTFWARGAKGGERVEFFAFNVGRDAFGNPLPGALHPDSSAKYTTCGPMGTPACSTYTTLTADWRPYTIPLTGADLSYVLGGFGWVTSGPQNGEKAITFFVDDIRYNLPQLQNPRLLVSYETISSTVDFDTVLRNTSFVYDDALALMAFLAAGQRERAQLVADALVYAQGHDRSYTDGRLRNAYQGGDLAVPPGWTPRGKALSARPPGWWGASAPGAALTWQEDSKLIGADTGNMAWAALALLNYYETRGGEQYKEAALRLAEWAAANLDTRGSGGYTGGITGGEDAPVQVPWKSTEHNIDLAVLFARVAQLTADPAKKAEWETRAAHARQFVESMWNPELCHFQTGTLNDGVTVNTQSIPLDAQTWALLAFGAGERTQQALRFVELNHEVTQQQDAAEFRGFDFNEDRDGLWLEGMGQMAVAYKLLGQATAAEAVLAEMREVQAQAPAGNGRGLVAAPVCCTSTGFDWEYYDRLHVGATAWYIFGELGYNPYWPQAAVPLFLPQVQK